MNGRETRSRGSRWVLAAEVVVVVAALGSVASGGETLGTRSPCSVDRPCAVTMELGVPVPMRDGVVLSTDVYRPDAVGRFPVILKRTPYDNATASNVARGHFWASRGFVYVIQDVRGRCDSDGDFEPLLNEAEDGYDAQTWCGTQPWSNGRVGTTGGSYEGWTQVFPAPLGNPHLAAMMPIATPPDPVLNIPLQHGAVYLPMVAWSAATSGRTMQDVSRLDLEEAYRTLPLAEIGERFGRRLETWREWLAHPTLDDYWRLRSYQHRLVDVTVPALHLSGWYDDDQVGTTMNFVELSRRARDPAARAAQKLVIGPWGHSPNRTDRIGPVDFGPDAIIDLDGLQVRWFERWLLGIDNGIDEEPPVRIFVMGANEWRDEQEWPLERTVYTSYYLHSGGRANSRFGDGVLSTEPPGDEPPDTFTYDPADPVPFLTDPDYHQIGGAEDYRAVERRDDVLVYTTAPLGAPLEVCGPLEVELYAASSARDTDWTAKVLDVHPDGYAQRLNDGIIRARFRHGLDREVLLEPGAVERYEIDCWATCVRLGVGHRLRLELSSSAFPKFDRNLNTGGSIGFEREGVSALQTIHHDRGRPSRLIVPVIPSPATTAGSS